MSPMLLGQDHEDVVMDEVNDTHEEERPTNRTTRKMTMVTTSRGHKYLIGCLRTHSFRRTSPSWRSCFAFSGNSEAAALFLQKARTAFIKAYADRPVQYADIESFGWL